MHSKGRFRPRRLAFAVLFLAVGLNGCALIHSENGNPPPDNALKKDNELAFVRSVIAWLRKEIANVGTRRFDYTVADFDYRGDDAGLRALVSNIRSDTARFAAGQAFVRDVLSEPLLVRVLDQVQVRVLSDEELAGLGHGELNGAFLDGTLYFRRKAIADAVTDPRPAYVLVVHEVLHALGFPDDAEPAVLGAADGGLLGNPTLAVPTDLAGLNSGEVIQRAAAFAALLSDALRGPRTGDDPGNGPTITWTTVSDLDFGGVGPNGAPLADSPMPGWVQPDGKPFKQFDGFHVTPNSALTDVADAVKNVNVRTAATTRNFRLNVDFVAGLPGTTFDAFVYFGAGYVWFRRDGLRLYSLASTTAVCNDNRSSFFGDQPLPFKLNVEVAIAAGQQSIRINGNPICSASGVVSQDSAITIGTTNARLDKILLEFGTEAAP